MAKGINLDKKQGEKTMNKDEGAYRLDRVYDQISQNGNPKVCLKRHQAKQRSLPTSRITLKRVNKTPGRKSKYF